MEYILEANQVSKSFGNYKALNEVSLKIPKGSIYGLLGPNGAGKTTFIRIVNQITYPDSGTIYFNNKPLQPEHVKFIGYLPEERGLYKSMKVGEQVLYLAQLKGLSKSEAKKRLLYWFEKFKITDWRSKKVQELSKGMAQKIQFIVTVLHEPDLLIFDEPFSGFDPINANLIKDEILELRDKGATIIFSTHRMESVEELCDDIALINKANKILDGDLQQIKRKFKSNTYQIGVTPNKNSSLESLLQASYTVSPATFKVLDGGLKLNVTLNKNQSVSELVQILNNEGVLTHFTEVIPSANDIFIQAVNQNI